MDRPRGIRPEGCEDFLRDLKRRIRAAQVRAVLAVNRELILLYWNIGREILDPQDRAGWGARIIDRLSQDSTRDFPEVTGFSTRNLKLHACLCQGVSDSEWGHNVRMLDYVKDPAQPAMVREGDAPACVERPFRQPPLR